MSQKEHNQNYLKPSFQTVIEKLNCISECVLNVLNGFLHLSICDKQKLRKHKAIYLKVAQSASRLLQRNFLLIKAEDFCCRSYLLCSQHLLTYYSCSMPIKFQRSLKLYSGFLPIKFQRSLISYSSIVPIKYVT